MVARQGEAPQECIETIDHRKIRVDDPGTARSAILLNPDKVKVRRIRMDACLVPRGEVAADWVVSVPRLIDVIVELKGRNVDHAVDQIEATRIFWSRHAERAYNQLIGAWIMCSEYPRASTKVARYRETLRARGTVLLVSTHNGEERHFSEFVPRHL